MNHRHIIWADDLFSLPSKMGSLAAWATSEVGETVDFENAKEYEEVSKVGHWWYDVFMLSLLDPKNLHHAYLFEGQRKFVAEELLSFLDKKLGIATVGNPDFWHLDFETMSIDDARAFKDSQLTKPIGKKKIFILSFNFITHEAQNSLLKVFEEPHRNTHFFLIVPRADILLPTIRSRVFYIEAPKKAEENEFEQKAKKFTKATKALRLELIKEMEKRDALAFLDALETVVHNTFITGDKSSAKSLEEILTCRSYLKDRSSSVKMLLEHLALVL